MQHIAILDFGSQYTHLIARRVRELGVLAKIYAPDIRGSELPADVAGIILSGGPQSVYDKGSLTIDPDILKLDKPILGLCYGYQLLAHILGGEVLPGKTREYGRASLCHSRPAICGGNPLNLSTLLDNIPLPTTVWMSHGDTVSKLPPDFTIISSTADCPAAAMAGDKRRIFGLQFHPEVHHTVCGQAILKNFVFKICGAKPNWRIDDLLADIVAKIKNQVNDKKIFLLVSGGVDSSVCFALLEKALGKERVFGLHIDTGFMRQDETKEIATMLSKAGYDNLRVEDASKIFYGRLRGITDPEQKRKIIGQTFLDVKDEAAAKLKLNPNEWILAQGTIYPDTIETGGAKHADRIKTHHNRVDAITELIAAGKIIEPIADFYKDEVRELGRLLGLPNELINRHPFPGPGLAIRVLCIQDNPLSLQRRGRGEGWRNSDDSRSSPHLTPVSSTGQALPSPLGGEGVSYSILHIKSVGVQGDNRTYAHPLAIWLNPPLPEGGSGGWEWDKLDDISHQITNSNREINRVLLLLNPPRDGKPTINSISPAYLAPERIELLRGIDAIVTKEIKKAGLYDTVWQCPVILLPLGQNKKESIVLRPVVSQEAMTANFARLPKDLIDKITARILATNKISYIFYDITNKPPGTIEWE